MGTNYAPLVADLFLLCYERDFMTSLSDDKQAGVIDAFITTSRYLDDILNLNNVYFDYTQTKKIRPIFMVLYLLIQLRCLSKNIPKCLSNVRHTKVGSYLILSSYLEELLNLK